jgi:hypothetical protein
MMYLPQLVQRTKKKEVFIAKKGAKYVTFRNGELRLSIKQSEAIAFETVKKLRDFIDYCTVDDRNAKVIGRSYGAVNVYTGK